MQGRKGSCIKLHKIQTASDHHFFCNYISDKLPWLRHTNSGQLFCNCPLYVTALVPGFFLGGKPAEMCCHSIVASELLNTQSVGSAGRKYYDFNTNTNY